MAQLATEPAEQGYRYVVLDKPDLGGFRPTDAARWQHGLVLRGAEWLRHTDAAQLRLSLFVENLPPQHADFHWFHELYAAGASVTQVDGQGVHPHYWRQGDLVVHDFVLPVGASTVLSSPVVVRVGSYSYPFGGTRERVTLSYGKITDHVDVELSQ